MTVHLDLVFCSARYLLDISRTLTLVIQLLQLPTQVKIQTTPFLSHLAGYRHDSHLNFKSPRAQLPYPQLYGVPFLPQILINTSGPAFLSLQVTCISSATFAASQTLGKVP